MFESLLIANRGEIACRVIRTAKRLGIRTIAVYSEADAQAQHVKLADQAVAIGESHPLKSYLNIDALTAAMAASKAAAVHPGYGFLSENARFARAVTAAGAVWVGPHVAAIEAMGNKQAARRTMAAAGVPLVPGADLNALDQARRAAADLTYPVMVKAAMGGGGIGMKIVYGEEDLEQAWNQAAARAQSAFGDATLYLEKYIEEPHHVEIQIFGDKHGNVVHMFERECSVQRRHQKVVEETPSPLLTPDTRQRMCAAAVQGVAALRYDGAGTLEFLVDKYQNFYFLEMNTRLQVEHPVTEAVTGLDLVEWQLRVAAGEALPRRQDQIHCHGHAVETRIYAENPKNFLPGPGRIDNLAWPDGEGVRVDTGVTQGDTITPFYDPMIAKLCVHGRHRDEAVARLKHALQATVVEGTLKTNLSFLGEVLDDPEFRMGVYNTHLVYKLRPQL